MAIKLNADTIKPKKYICIHFHLFLEFVFGWLDAGFMYLSGLRTHQLPKTVWNFGGSLIRLAQFKPQFIITLALVMRSD